MTRRPTPTLVIALVALASSLTGTAIATSRDPFVANCLTASEPVSQYSDPATHRTYLDAQHALGQPHLYVMLVKPSCVPRPKTIADLAWRWPAPAKPEGQVSK